ncbi:formylglycine-generating enzyme family protein [Geovibrio thiophilus]|uniref:Formylglycine-generating enzyme family protein n=1 Tax=Geovibrio thiophilus TaxID=139438 RepID=A0A3R5V1M3_9BACT|nr:formylglycine-generating enzyme family protein [Geovibrio thiophilus]QAR33417.1 formylglycine-generating enzyme family protein [Geovibrio thiophilus]
MKKLLLIILFIPAIALAENPNSFKDKASGIEFVFVKGGCYMMGGTSMSDSEPIHEVCVDSFYISKYETTQKQWEKIMGNNPSYYKACGPDCPVESVSWYDVQDYIKKLNELSKKNYRLPTEAEWEYAARGGENYKYAGSDNPDEIAVYNERQNAKTHKVGQKKPNGFGLYDMTCNVMEWTLDVFAYYSEAKHTKNNPVYLGKGFWRVVRDEDCSYSKPHGVEIRTPLNPIISSIDTGFRLVLPIK